MKIQFDFKHLDYSENLQNYIEAEMQDIAQFLLKDSDAHCYISKRLSGDCTGYFDIEITVGTKEKYFKATATGMDIYATANDVLEKIQKQFMKVKQKYRKHKHFELSKSGKMRQMNSQLEWKGLRRKAA